MSQPATDPAAFDEAMMRRALELAKRGWGTTHPNPMVGAVIVEEGKIVAEGWHSRAGEAHAEVAALRTLGRTPKPGATFYVTLEPCSTRGRTGACVEAILNAGIQRIVVAADDPNPAHAGRAYAILREQGVSVTTGVLAKEAAQLNFIFNHSITTGEPLLAAKLALTLDGKLATRNGHSRWITGEHARLDVMRWRALFPAIVIGAGTLRADDPALTIRDEGGDDLSCPNRYILSRSAESLLTGDCSYRIFNDNFRSKTTVVTGTDNTDAIKRFEALGVRCVALKDTGGDSQRFLQGFRRLLVEDGMTGALIEPGARLFSVFLRAKMVDYGIFYLAPKLVADAQAPGLDGWAPEKMSDALCLQEPTTALFPPDVRITGFFDFGEDSAV